MKDLFTYNEFVKTLNDSYPKTSWPEILKALWYDAQGNWQSAHEIVDSMDDSKAKRIHAYLHRKEGDEWNAAYWYRLVGETLPEISFEEEHRQLVDLVLRGGLDD